MEKNRQKKYLIFENLEEKFNWINNIKSMQNFIPTAKETYYIDFKSRLENFEYQNTSKKSEISRFEKFILDFFEVSKGRSQAILCWRETEVIIIIF